MPNNQPKSRLGRGLDSLIPTNLSDIDAALSGRPLAVEDEAGSAANEQVYPLDLASIDPNPHQPRREFDEESLDELAQSIKEHGVLQPIVVNKVGDRYELVAGERRVKASMMAGLEKVPALIRSTEDREKLELGLVENLQRKDLNPMERALAYHKLATEFKMGPHRISVRIGRSKKSVEYTLRLLMLPGETQKAIADGLLSEGHGRALSYIEDKDDLLALMKTILDEGLSMRQTEELIRRYRTGAAGPKKQEKAAKEYVEYAKEIVSDLREKLGTKVEINKTAKGGKIVIEFYSDEELERIHNQIKGS